MAEVASAAAATVRRVSRRCSIFGILSQIAMERHVRGMKVMPGNRQGSPKETISKWSDILRGSRASLPKPG